MRIGFLGLSAKSILFYGLNETAPKRIGLLVPDVKLQLKCGSQCGARLERLLEIALNGRGEGC